MLVRDFSADATRLHGKSTTSEKQAEFALQMIRRPQVHPERFAAVWGDVPALMDTSILSGTVVRCGSSRSNRFGG